MFLGAKAPLGLASVTCHMSGRCLEDILRVSGGYLECVRKVIGKSWDSVWRLSGRCLETFKIVLSVKRILE